MDILNEIYRMYHFDVMLEYYGSNVELGTSLTRTKRIEALEKISDEIQQELASNSHYSGSIWLINNLKRFKGCKSVDQLRPYLKLESIESFVKEVGRQNEQVRSIALILAKMKIENEIQDLHSSITAKSSFKSKIPAKFYVLEYLIGLKATNSPLPIGGKLAKQEIGEEILGEGRGETFYKQLNKLSKINIDDKREVEDVFGIDWIEKVVSISRNKTLLESHIKKLNLI